MMSSEERRTVKRQRILIFESAHALSNYLLEQWVQMAQEAVARNNRFTVALSGGRSPMEFYCKLSSLTDFSLWQRTHIFIGDERFVPWEDSSSNYKMIKESLLDYINIPPENIHPISTDQRNVDLAADQYKNELVQFFEFKDNNAPRFDFVLLGIGTDGHTASLFPEDERVDDPSCLVLPVSLPKLKHERISLTLPVINNAHNVITLVVGANKSEIAEQIIERGLKVPVSKVEPTDGQLMYILDKEAAQKLPYKDSYSHEGHGVFYEFGK